MADPIDITKKMTKKMKNKPSSINSSECNGTKLSDIEKRVRQIMREAGGVTDDGDPIDKEVLKKFLQESEESKGFYFSKFPGSIDGVTDVYPNQSVLDNRYKCPEEYDKFLYLATLAVATYNINHGTRFKVVEIKHLNVAACRNLDSYITFSAVEVRGEKGLFSYFFRAKYIIMIVLLLLCFDFWKKVSNLTREWSFREFKATESDLHEKDIVLKTFRALVMDNVIDGKREVSSVELLT